MRSCRDGQRHRHRARQPGRDPSRRASPTKSRWRASTRYDALGLVTSGDPYTMDQKTRTPRQKNPRWVPAISTATSASIGAHVGTHAAAEAARVIFRFGCGRRRWSCGASRRTIRAPRNGRRRRWKDGQLVMPGLPPLPLPALAAKSACAQSRDRRDGPRLFPLGLVARALSRSPDEQYRAEIDALALRKGNGKFERIDRSASNSRRPTTTGSAPAIPRCAARWSASRSSAPPARCASPRPTACSNAARRWCRRW